MKRWLVPAGVLAAGFAALIVWVQMTLDPTPPAARHEGFAQHLMTTPGFEWETEALPFGHLHYIPGTHASRTVNELTAAIDSARKQVLEFFTMQMDTQRIDVFVVETREDMTELVGRPIGGMVASGERTAIFLYNQQYKPFIVHELAHLYTHYHWGKPHGRWISEGLAMLATGNCQGHTVHELAAGLAKAGQLRPWRDFADEFDDISELPANIQAASMLDHLRSIVDIDGLRQFWTSGDWKYIEQNSGRTVPEIEKRWEVEVRMTQPAVLDSVKLRNQGC